MSCKKRTPSAVRKRSHAHFGTILNPSDKVTGKRYAPDHHPQFWMAAFPTDNYIYINTKKGRVD